MIGPFLLEPATARDIVDGLRLLEGRLISGTRRLSPGALELRALAESSRRFMTAQFSGTVALVEEVEHDEVMTPQLLTFTDAGRVLGGMSLATVKRLVASGELPAVHIGRNARIRKADLDSFVESLKTSQAAS